MTSRRFQHAIWFAGFLAVVGITFAEAMPAPRDAISVVPTIEGASPLEFAQAQPSPSPSPPTIAPAPAATPDQPTTPEEPIGNVATLTGVATVTRNDTAIPLKVKDDIYLNDVVQTQPSSSLSITFSDATTFRLSANAQITIDSYIYEDGGKNNKGAFDIAKGTVAFVAAQVAKTGNMQITTPTATLGIRGTTGLVEVPEGAAAANSNNVNIKLYPDPDAHVGRIEINDRQGGSLGTLTQGASGFAIRPGSAGARFAAVPITISPQAQQRDQGFVRQVHAAQTTGRQIYTERRDFRRANPSVVNPNAPRRQGGMQPGQNRAGQPNNRPGQPNTPQQPGQNRQGQPTTPNSRQGQQQQPGQTRPGQPGQTTQPANALRPTTPTRPGQTTPTTSPATPGATRPGQTTPANPAQPGAPRRPGINGAQPSSVPSGTPGVQPNGQPRTQGPPPLPSGQPILRQSGQPNQGGLQRPGLQNRPGGLRPVRPAPAPKGKKEKR